VSFWIQRVRSLLGNQVVSAANAHSETAPQASAPPVIEGSTLRGRARCGARALTCMT